MYVNVKPKNNWKVDGGGTWYAGRFGKKKVKKGLQTSGLVLSSKLRKWMAKSDRERTWKYASKKRVRRKSSCP